MNKYLKPFDQIGPKEVRLFGGKAFSLGRMLQFGIPVPSGFAVSVDAQKDFQGRKFTAEFKQMLGQAFDRLKSERVAVRSSAVAEDASEASWAGQLETYLNVGRGELESSIRKCWESINTKRAIVYRQDKHLSEEDLLVGVAVQSMLQSEVSGVMFTADPITGNKDLIVIEGLYGLGELLVQGIITPDRFTVNKKSVKVIDFNIAIKEKKMISQGGQNKIVKIVGDEQNRAVLKEDQVLVLAELGKKIEKFYGTPQDIEWALVGRKFYILQSRPITTLH